MTEKHITLAKKITNRYSTLSQVEAIVLGGSLASGTADPTSDIDLYIYLQEDIPAEQRLTIAREYSPDAQANDFWGAGNEWIDPESGIHADLMFWTVGWIEDQIDRTLRRHEAWVGYTTCFWHTIRNSQILFDRNGWFKKLHTSALVAYPEALVPAIIAQNYPILRKNESAYFFQIKKAVERNDLISINHRVAEFLASYFDIIFAINRCPHPGEKRLLKWAEMQCNKLPNDMSKQVNDLIRAIPKADQSILVIINDLVNGLDELLGKEE